jgi:CheY-like chemotaxis protein
MKVTRVFRHGNTPKKERTHEAVKCREKPMTGEAVLIVEDEGLLTLHLTEMLEQSGYQVREPANSGEMALEALEKCPKPDIILMDIGLAGSLDGIDTARKIQQRFLVPVIFITAFSSESVLPKMIGVTQNGVVVKPFVDAELLDLIRKALTHFQSQQAPPNITE